MAKARRKKQPRKARDLAARKRVTGGRETLASSIQKKDSDTKSAIISKIG